MLQQELYNTLFETNAGNGNAKEMLRGITDQHPYFSVAHFYLLKETSNTDFYYKKTAARTALHFNNPFWLNYQLKKKLRPLFESVERENVENVTSVPKVEEAQVVENVERENVEIVPEVQKVEEVQVAENVPTLNVEPETAPKIEEAEVVENVERENLEIVPEVQKVEEVQAVENVATLNVKPEASPKEELLFEPLYTTDYFASQGIKLSEEVQTNDKLGKQLKSFTDWLKTMKKLHHGKLPETNAAMDIAVQNLAEKSNKEEEILTEAMADVYIQQGKIEKAHEIYRKLSLLNPAKSAYFAAKIELLKEH